MIEEFSEADGEEEIAEEGVLEAGEQQRLGRMVGEGKESAAKDTKTYGKPIAEDDVDEAEGKGAGKDHGPTTAKKRLVAAKEKGSVEKLLRKNRNDWIEKHDQGPEDGGASDEGEKEAGSGEANRQAKSEHADGVTTKQCRKIIGDASKGE